MTDVADQLPSSWAIARIDDLAEVNPKLDKSEINDQLEVSFVPMPAVEAGTGRIDVTATRRFAEVKKGYTPFREGDILFAKITPCMENGKMAVVPALHNGLGFGSTEFHVLRPVDGISAKFLYYFISSQRFRFDAEHNMTGAVGQRRVPTAYLSEHPIHIPPANEQRRIVAKIAELFSELDSSVESLTTAREQLHVYRLALLNHAFQGKLTAQWREDNRDKLETAEQLLIRIRNEREASYQKQLAEWEAAVKDWDAQRQNSRKSVKPKKPDAIQPYEDNSLPELPEGWLWLRYGDLCSRVRNGVSEKPDGDGGAKIFRISAVRPMEFVLDDLRYIDNSDGRYDEYFLQPGDLVFTRYNGSRAYVGVCAGYRSDGTHLFPDKLIQTRLSVSSILPSYVEKAVNCGRSRAFVEQRIRTTAGQSGISGADIKSIPVPICSQAEQAKLIELLSQNMSRSNQLLVEIEVVLTRGEALRQSILKKAFSGNLVSQDLKDEPASILLERIRSKNSECRPAGHRRKAVANA